MFIVVDRQLFLTGADKARQGKTRHDKTKQDKTRGREEGARARVESNTWMLDRAWVLLSSISTPYIAPVQGGQSGSQPVRLKDVCIYIARKMCACMQKFARDDTESALLCTEQKKNEQKKKRSEQERQTQDRQGQKQEQG
jgi:hypothetical protein